MSSAYTTSTTDLSMLFVFLFFFFFNDTATTEIYTLSLHDALPIYPDARPGWQAPPGDRPRRGQEPAAGDRKSTRLNSSHSQISYAVFCLKKKKKRHTKRKIVLKHDTTLYHQQLLTMLRHYLCSTHA